MKILVCAFHPNIAESRVNKRWLEAISNDPQINVHEVYSTYPKWSFDLKAEQQLMESSRSYCVLTSFPVV